MTFLAPFALVGVLLLALPIAVHLFKPRKMKRTPFSSLRWLKATHQRLSRRIQWHQWLLFLLRAGCILLLVLALARPIIGTSGADRPTDRFVILDASRSMAYKASEEFSSWDRAKDLAGQIAKTARSGDRTAVVLAGRTPRLIAPPSADASSGSAAIDALGPGLADNNLSAVLPMVRSLLPRDKERVIELVFLTDNLQARWQQKDVQAFLHQLPNPVNAKIIDTGAGSAQNAWIASARLYQFGADEDRWIRVEVGCVGEVKSARNLRLAGIAGIEDDVQPITLKPGQLAQVAFRIPASVNLQGQAAELRLEPADALPSDDLFFLNLDVPWSLRVLLIEPETPGQDGRNVGLFLQTAMKALTASKNQALGVATRTSTTVTPSDLQKADIVLLAGVPELSETALESLQTRVRFGAGLALFLGPQIKFAFYNTKLYRPQQPAEGLLPLALKIDSNEFAREGKAGTLTNIRWMHPMLASLQDPVLSDFPHSQFHRYGNLAGTLGKNDVVLARFDDETPAILERPIGAGRVLVFNTSANDDWSDLPRQKSFLPLVDRMLSYLSAGGAQRSFTVGDAVTLPLPEYQATSVVTVVSPRGVKMTPRLIMQRSRTLLHLDEVTEAGVFRVEGGGDKDFAFAVNTSRTDSPLRPMDAKTLRAWWEPATLEIVSTETAGAWLREQSKPWPLWPALVALAGVLLVAETIYVHRLCPRADPKAADAVVPQRGVLKPVASD